METTEAETVAGVHVRQVERDIPPHHGMRGKFGEPSRQSSEQRGANELPRNDREIHDRRDRQLRVWNQHTRGREQ